MRYNFDNQNSILFNSEEIEKLTTEFYNLIYEYKNDCLIAAVEYNKDYYQDRDLKPRNILNLNYAFCSNKHTNLNSEKYFKN